MHINKTQKSVVGGDVHCTFMALNLNHRADSKDERHLFMNSTLGYVYFTSLSTSKVIFHLV